ncbi:MAG: DUF6597 domain-containing transcriptional factor [Saprospiraceae bacterium]|nr:helix-turn-helix domain-containing protein [Lewinella sp.]
MVYEEFKVPENLQDYLLCYWKFTGPRSGPDGPIRHYIPPDACPSLIFFTLPQFDVKGTTLFGPTKYIAETQVFRGSISMGIRFRPGVISGLFGQSGQELRDQNIQPAPILNGLDYEQGLDLVTDAAGWQDYLNQTLPLVIARSQPHIPQVLQQAMDTILSSRGNIRISDLLETIPLSERQLQKTFKQEVGLTLKEFATVMRLRASIIQMELEGKGYQDMVFDSGYYDQAHFIRDFSKLSRISLPDFKRYIKNIRHVGVSFRL